MNSIPIIGINGKVKKSLSYSRYAILWYETLS